MTQNVIRLSIGATLAMPVAGGLFFIMQYLISSADPEIDDSKLRKVEEILMPEDRSIDTNLTEKVDRPDDPEDEPPPPDTPDVEVEIQEITNVDPRFTVSIKGGVGIGKSDGEYLPIVKVAPIYPRRAQTRGIEGYCIVEYTVTPNGSIRDPQAIDCSPPGIFERASVRASLKFKYKPRVVDGEPIEVAGVQNKFTYELED